MHLLIKPFVSIAILAIATLHFQACHPANNSNGQKQLPPNPNPNKFADYWFGGNAEVNTYDIRQSRYGEERTGQAVMVFVTEDFSKEKQVKLDNAAKAGNDKIPVMKLNHIRRFVTGIYDYSMMQSVFTPIDLNTHPKTLKTTTTVQDWCGHTFMQLNLEGGKYRLNSFSYFESEGDMELKLSCELLEDELWTRLRIAPESIPEGNVDIVPSAFFARLNHMEPEVKQARIRFEDQETITYLMVEYLHLDRTLSIGFEPKFPYKILSWNEQIEGRTVSAGKLKSSINSAYWRQQDNVHVHLRDSLLLKCF